MDTVSTADGRIVKALPSTPARPPEMIDPHRPVWRDQHGAVHVHGFDDVAHLMRNGQASLDVSGTPGFDPALAHVSLLFSWATDTHPRSDGSPGRHQVLWELLLPWLGAATVPGRRSGVQQIAEDVVGDLPASFDCYRDLGTSITVPAVASMVGIPEKEVEWLLDCQRLLPPMGAGLPPQQPEVDDYLHDVMQRPGLDGMAGAMRDAASRGLLSPREAHAMVWGAVQASTLNVAASITATVGLLVEHNLWPLRADRVPGAVEEAVRLAAPFPVSLRVAIAPIELPSGATVAAGEMVMLHSDAAGRDPRGGYDLTTPIDQFDPDRQPNRHLGWGTGRHRCMGVALARTIITTAVNTLAAHRPLLELNGPWQRYISTEDGYISSPLRSRAASTTIPAEQASPHRRVS